LSIYACTYRVVYHNGMYTRRAVHDATPGNREPRYDIATLYNSNSNNIIIVLYYCIQYNNNNMRNEMPRIKHTIDNANPYQCRRPKKKVIIIMMIKIMYYNRLSISSHGDVLYAGRAI